MHDAVVVVADSQRVYLLHFEVGLSARHHVVPEEVDVRVAIRSALLVPEPDGVAELVDFCGKLYAAGSQ